MTDEAGSLTRRGFFERVAGGIHGAALATLLSRDLFGGSGLLAAEAGAGESLPDLRPRRPHFQPKAKAVIHLFMNGGPSQMDLFDPKPMLDKHHGEPLLRQDRRRGREHRRTPARLMRSPFKFAQHGECGMWVSDAMPHLARQVDDIALIRSMFTTNLTHEPAIYLIQSGKMGPGRPVARARGWSTAWAARTRTCRPTSCSTTRSACRSTASRTGSRASCRRSIQGRGSARPGSPVLNLRPDVERPAGRRPARARPARAARSDSQGDSGPASRTSTRGSPATSWPRGCSWRRPTPSTLTQESAETLRDVRHRPRADRLLRPPLPDRPPAGRARRAVRAALHQRADLGQPHRRLPRG